MSGSDSGGGIAFPYRIPFVETLGLELLRLEAGEAEIALTLREGLCNSLDVAHGGVTMTLLDVAMAHAARSANGSSHIPRRLVTIEMKTSFMRPGTGRLLARGRVLTRTLTMAFCEGSVFDAGGARVAHATGTFKYLAARPPRGAPPPETAPP